MERNMGAENEKALAKYTFTVKGRLPGMNEYTDAQRANRYKGASMKRDFQNLVTLYIRTQLHGLHITRPVRLRYHFYEPNRRRDLDNISSFARKVVQDALVATGVLVNDGWGQIRGSSEEFDVDKRHPRIEITIEEVEA